MAYNSLDFSALVRVDPEKAAVSFLREYRRAKCKLKEAAASLGISVSTEVRLVKILCVKVPTFATRLDAVALRAMSEGWHHFSRGARTRGKGRRRPARSR
jgi:predicted P-loop ATPase/GTPase